MMITAPDTSPNDTPKVDGRKDNTGQLTRIRNSARERIEWIVCVDASVSDTNSNEAEIDFIKRVKLGEVVWIFSKMEKA